MALRGVSPIHDEDDGMKTLLRAGIAAGAGPSTVCFHTAWCGDKQAPRPQAVAPGFADSDEEAPPPPRRAPSRCGGSARQLVAAARLRPGEVVLDVGCGTGVRSVAAAREVGGDGRVIGTDVSRDVLGEARSRAEMEGAASNVSFRLGEAVHLPVGDAAVDCVLVDGTGSLDRQRARVLHEFSRVLAPGGRICVVDALPAGDLPARVRAKLGGLREPAGATAEGQLHVSLTAAGFTAVSVELADVAEVAQDREPGSRTEDMVVSVLVCAEKRLQGPAAHDEIRHAVARPSATTSPP